jgi:hypothetical protein
LRVEDIKPPEIGRAGRASGSKNCMHARRNRGSSGSGRRNTGGTEEKLLELFSGEQRIRCRGIVREEVGAGLGAEGGEGGGVKVIKGVNSEGNGRNRRRQTGGSGGGEREALGDLVEDRGGGRDTNGLTEREPKVERERRERKARIDGRRGDGGTKSEIGDASRTDGGVGRDIGGCGGAVEITEAKSDEILEPEESRSNGGAAARSLETSIVRTTRNVPESSN